MRIERLWLIRDLMRTSEAFRGRKEFVSTLEYDQFSRIYYH